MVVESLFNHDDSIGVFKGFVEGGMEFHADLVLPYAGKLNNLPMHGMYLLIQLENLNEAVLGRITTISSDGKLATGAGDDYNIRAAKSKYPVSETLKEEYLKYRVNVRVLGGLKLEAGKVVFVPSFRRIPSVGAPVCFPSEEVLKELANSNGDGAPIGIYALGKYIYAGDNAEKYDLNKPWMNIMYPEVRVNFDVNAMVARRSFVFARAGFGKSNLNKLLFSQLYQTTPYKQKGDKKVPVGTIVFDRDGEYFWPDDQKRSGLCDVKGLRDNLVVFTNRHAPNPFYDSFVAGNIKIDLRTLPASAVISIAVSQDRQDQQNIRKLRGLSDSGWKEIVDIAYSDGYQADSQRVKDILHISENGEAEAAAAISNITHVVKMLHDPESRFLEMLLMALSEGKLCIVDMSMYGSESALILSGIILKHIFKHNQDEFTKAESKSIPTIAVLEEAQSVLTPGKGATEPFISWVKEGRKYDLGALMITQQPGSISTDILSQGDNWFVFHLLSDKDLQDVRRANAHFSNDLLSSLLNEPIVGQGVFWSSVPDKDNNVKPYPIPLRILSFQDSVEMLSESERKDHIDNYVQLLKARMQKLEHIPNAEPELDVLYCGDPDNAPTREDILAKEIADVLFKNIKLMDAFDANERYMGVAYGKLIGIIEEMLNEDEFNRSELAKSLIFKVVGLLLGKENEDWEYSRGTTPTTSHLKFFRRIKKNE